MKNGTIPTGLWHLQFTLCKQFYLKKPKVGTNVPIQEELHYRSTSGSFKSVTKKR
jgi:hypothetical protein